MKGFLSRRFPKKILLTFCTAKYFEVIDKTSIRSGHLGFVVSATLSPSNAVTTILSKGNLKGGRGGLSRMQDIAVVWLQAAMSLWQSTEKIDGGCWGRCDRYLSVDNVILVNDKDNHHQFFHWRQWRWRRSARGKGDGFDERFKEKGRNHWKLSTQ
jgi:hypothetical protein